MVTWNDQTYKIVAEVLNSMSYCDLETLNFMVHKFVTVFERDNPHFDRDRFYRVVFGEQT